MVGFPIKVVALLVLWAAIFVAVPRSTIANSLPATPSPSPQLPSKDKTVIYSGAAIIDGTGGPLRADMAIIVRGERIEGVMPRAKLKVPAGAEVVDTTDQYALPGFINSHEHLATPPNRKIAEAMMRRDLFSGVTAVPCMGDDLRALADLARASRILEIPGPDLTTLHCSRDVIS